MKPWLRLTVALLVVALGAPVAAVSAPAASQIYVAHENFDLENGAISQYGVLGSGALSPLVPPFIAADSGTRALAASPDGKSLYSTGFLDRIAQYDVLSTGALIAKSPATVAVGPAGADDPVDLIVSPDGRSVYLAMAGGPGVVAQYTVGADGTLTPKTPQFVEVLNPPPLAPVPTVTALAASPDGRRLYAAAYAGGDRFVAQFDVDAAGKLILNNSDAPTGGLPYRILIHPDGRSLYVLNAEDGASASISQYDLNVGGTPVPKAPAKVNTGSASSVDMAVSPDGKYVYTANLSPNSISQFTVGAGGRLIPTSPPLLIPAGASSVAVSSDSRSFYVASFNAVSQYSIGADGSLTPKTPASIPSVRFGIDIAVNPPPRTDGIPPVLTVPSGLTVNATSLAGSRVTYTASATDNVDTRLEVVCKPPSGSTFPIGTTNVTCTATDDAGNTVTDSFNVVVRLPASKDECKSGRWRAFGTVFRNQGDCVSFVATKGKNPPARGIG